MKFEKIREYCKRYWYVLAAILLAVVAGVITYLYISYMFEPSKPPVIQKENPQPVQPPKQKPENAGIVCPLDGMPLEELPARRYLAVSIDNSPEARPQSGLKDAELVIEFPVEGGTTRFLAFYYHKDAARIGPVRSARPYLAEKANEYGAVLTHVGKSPQTDTYFKKNNIEHIDEMPNTPGFWRENNRKAPHNLYTSTMNMWDNLSKNGQAGTKSLQGLKFQTDAILHNAKDSAGTTIFYPYGEVVYQYQPVDKDYLRFISGKAHIDAENFLPLRMKNIIIQFVDTKILDGEGRLSLNLNSKGRAIISSGGKTTEGTWEKQSNDVTKYFDAEGKEIILPPGQTWIEIVQSNMHIDY